ncbi:MAG: hypothetical protein KF715_21740 [Candidatus Didemnitutus sp.]|nr:hypothetical protein [Candidatus Didemnitutus sp.]
METKNFKALFSAVAEQNGFTSAFGGWFADSPECIIALDLQKSNFGNYLELNLKIYVQGMFGNTYVKNKDLLKKSTGDVFTRPPDKFRDALDLGCPMDGQERERKLAALFAEFVVPIATRARTRSGLQVLGLEAKVFLLPAVENELKKSV